jgi:hypothetical protein
MTPNIFVFSDPETGHRHGYFDGWKADGAFHYSGEGQRGDQRLVKGNAALLQHADRRRHLRLFLGTGGNVLYRGEFRLASDRPWYFDEAPETEDGPLRQVLVFRLVPTETVDRTSEEISPTVTSGNLVSTVSLERQHCERFVFAPLRDETEAERREHSLVRSYAEFLEAKKVEVARRRYEPPGESRPLYCDLYESGRRNLVEAKGSACREAVRMAIGQLLDYARFEPHGVAKALLLPERPRSDLEQLLASAGIAAVWPDGPTGFNDNAGGRFS